MGAPASALWDAAQFLDVHMHQLAWCLLLVAHSDRLAHRQAGGLVQICQLGHPVAGQDAFDNAAGNAEVVADSEWSPLAVESQGNDAVLALAAQSCRATRRA